MALNPGLILDRDGVINLDTGYLHRIEECQFVEGIFPLGREFSRRGFRIVIATNQSGIGRGLFDEQIFGEFMTWMVGRFADEGVVIDRIYHCPDHPTEGIGRYRRETDWRKPGSGMFRQAIADLALDPAACWAIGDRPHDLVAAAGAGVAHRVLYDTAAPATTWTGRHWIVPHLSMIAGLLP